MRTGDLGVYLDGELYVTGRIADLLSIDDRHHYPRRHRSHHCGGLAHGPSRLWRQSGFSVPTVDGRHQLVIIAERAAGTSRLGSATGD